MAPTWRLIHSDDFTGYTSDADVNAAYAPDPPSHYVEDATDWGATNGPDGQPGIRNQTVAPSNDSGIIKKGGLTPACRGFRVKGRFDFANTGGILTIHEFLTIEDEEEAFVLLVQLSRVHSTETLRVSIKSAAPYASGPLFRVTIDAAGVLPNTPTDIELQGERSTIVETSPGVFAPDADGWVKVYVNGVEEVSFIGIVWNGDSSLNPAAYWNVSRIQTIGAFTNWEVYDSVDCLMTEPPICECEPPPTVPPKLPPTIPKNPPQTPPFIGQQLACIGGGLVPTQADLTYIENWWGL